MNLPSGVLVTGGSRGIGRECCKHLAEMDIPVVSLSRSLPENPAPTETPLCVDLSDVHKSAEIVRSALQEHRVSALVCNAGRGDIGSLENFSATQITQSLMLNLASPLVIARECIPAFRRLQRSNIVFIGSTSGLSGARYGTLYSAAKFGLRGIAQSLAPELAAANCHVSIINPGMVRTGFFDTLDFEPGPESAHALQAGDVARAVINTLTSPDHAVIREMTITPRHHVVKKRPG